MKISMTVLKLESGHDFQTNNFKGALFWTKSSRSNGSYLMLLYICTMFHGNILDGIKVIEQTRFS